MSQELQALCIPTLLGQASDRIHAFIGVVGQNPGRETLCMQ
jgi:hypothetical protein